MDLHSIIGKGYFPEELPPSFTTQKLGEKIRLIWNKQNGKTYKLKSTPLTPFSIPKIKNYRRYLSIPHPLTYINLCNTLVQNWEAIKTHCDLSKISVARLNYKEDSLRAIDKPNFEQFNEDRITRSTGCRYVLRADIAKCYDSIFIESLTTALHNSRIAESTVSRIMSESKKLQNGMPIGLPIGPDTSRIISEIILAAIDQELQSKIVELRGMRIVDDYYLYFNSIGESEVANAIIQQTLKKFKLDLNQGKEKVFEIPEIIDEEWIRDLREFQFRNDPLSQRRDIIAFFDKAILYANRYPQDFVLSFAVPRLKSVEFAETNWNLIQSLLYNCLLIEPKIINYIAEFITQRIPRFFLSESLLKYGLENFILNHLELNNDYEICWTLWIYRHLNIPLPARITEALIKNTNPFVIITALDLANNHLAPGLKKEKWNKYFTKTNLYTEYWVLAYEAARNKWSFPKNNYVKNDPFFKVLDNAGIAFYDSTQELDLSRTRIPVADFYA